MLKKYLIAWIFSVICTIIAFTTMDLIIRSKVDIVSILNVVLGISMGFIICYKQIGGD